MKFSEKITTGAFIAALTAAFTLYGVWEDKALVLAPVLVTVYLAAGLAAVRFSSLPLRSPAFAVPSSPSARFRFQVSGFRIPPGGVPLLLFWFYSIARIPFSELPYEAKISSLGLGGYVAVYWISAGVLSRFSARKAVWSSVFILMVMTALYSLVQHKIAPDLIYGIERYTHSWTDGRLGGTYQCPNHIAHLFQMWIPLCLVFLFIPQFGWFWRICFAYGLPLFLLLIYQTQSRAGILGTVAALGATVLLLVLRKNRKAFYVSLVVVPLLGAVAVGGLWAGSSMFRTRMQPVAGFAAQCLAGNFEFTDTRPQAWLDTLPMIADRPLFGFGPGNYGHIYETYRKRVLAVRIEMVHAHNEYLELLAEYGVTGGILVLCVLGSVSVRLVRLIRTSPQPHHALPAAALLGALAGTAVHGFFDFELRIFPNALMLALLAGCAVAPLVQTVSPGPAKRNKAVQWIFTVAVLLSAVWSLQLMSSAWAGAYGNRLQQNKQLRKAERFLRAAVRIDPQNWPAGLGLGKMYYQRRYYELDPVRKQDWARMEQAAYAEAYRLNPLDEEVVYGLGCAELFLGNRDAGLDYLRQVANHMRFNDFYWRKLGIELRKAGLYEEARSAFEQALKLDRSNRTVKRNIEWLDKKHPESGKQNSGAR